LEFRPRIKAAGAGFHRIIPQESLDQLRVTPVFNAPATGVH
jgi:hypothetical protein